MGSAENSIPEEITEIASLMHLAKNYNNITGANITHQDVAKWGYFEAAKIKMAIDYIQGN